MATIVAAVLTAAVDFAGAAPGGGGSQPAMPSDLDPEMIEAAIKGKQQEQVKQNTPQPMLGSGGIDQQVQPEGGEQQRLREGAEEGGQAQEQEREQQKMGEDATATQTKNQQRAKGEGQGATSTGQMVAVQRRSQVANAVQQILQVADRSGGIDGQVKIIAQEQSQNQEKLETSLQAVQGRNGFVMFLIGPNYVQIKNAQKLLDRNQQLIEQLNQAKTKLSNEGDQQILAQQIQTLELVNGQMQNYLKEAGQRFSLFGWLVKIFVK